MSHMGVSHVTYGSESCHIWEGRLVREEYYQSSKREVRGVWSAISPFLGAAQECVIALSTAEVRLRQNTQINLNIQKLGEP